jgi:hypothetical protein
MGGALSVHSSAGPQRDASQHRNGHEWAKETELVDRAVSVEVADVEHEMQETLDQPRGGDWCGWVLPPQRPDSDDDHCGEQPADIANQVLVVEVSGGGDPVPAKWEVIEE